MKVFLDNYSGHATCKRQMPYWQAMGVKATGNPAEANIHLANVRTARPQKIPIVQRLDGIYYDSDTAYNQRNNQISATHAFAAGIIYQSEYCKAAGEYYLKKRKGPCRVIYNGIEPNWAGPRDPSDVPTIVVSAKWRRHKRLPEILKLFTMYKDVFPQAELLVMGDLRGSSRPDSVRGVKYLGHISHKAMREYFRKSWFSIHLSKRDACPNSTVEAIGAGVPVITTNACGGGTEMCEMTEGCIVVEGDAYTIKPVPHYRNGYNQLDKPLYYRLLKAMVTLTEDGPQTVIPPTQLTAKHMAEQYVSFMRSLI
jgi:glycosyltransferase involved in cell wall biosynthesis